MKKKINKNFLIISMRRCGSTFLSLELNRYKSISCSHEMVYWGKNHPVMKPNYIPIMYDKQNLPDEIDRKVVENLYKGSKLTIPEYQFEEIHKIIEILKNQKLKIIHITRSMHEQMISVMMAKKSGVWHNVKDNVNIPDWVKKHATYKPEENKILGKVTLSPSLVEEFCMKIYCIDNALIELKKSQQYLHVNYKDLNTSKIIEIATFISGSDKLIKDNKIHYSPLKRVITNKHEDFINNWNEVKKIFEKWEAKRVTIL